MLKLISIVLFVSHLMLLVQVIVIYDWRGTFIHAMWMGGFVDLTFARECFVTRVALTIAYTLGLRCFVLEGDSLDVIYLLLDH